MLGRDLKQGGISGQEVRDSTRKASRLAEDESVDQADARERRVFTPLHPVSLHGTKLPRVGSSVRILFGPVVRFVPTITTVPVPTRPSV